MVASPGQPRQHGSGLVRVPRHSTLNSHDAQLVVRLAVPEPAQHGLDVADFPGACQLRFAGGVQTGPKGQQHTTQRRRHALFVRRPLPVALTPPRFLGQGTLVERRSGAVLAALRTIVRELGIPIRIIARLFGVWWTRDLHAVCATRVRGGGTPHAALFIYRARGLFFLCVRGGRLRVLKTSTIGAP